MLPFARAIPWRHPPDPGTLIPPNELANLRRIATRVFHVFIEKTHVLTGVNTPGSFRDALRENRKGNFLASLSV